jgi:hypothetical protein
VSQALPVFAKMPLITECRILLPVSMLGFH